MAILNIKDSLGQWQRVSTLDGVTPHIDQTNKHWFIGTTDTGILAEGVNGTNGTNGVTPHIDATTKHWMIGTTDTGIVAEGVDGEDGTIINVGGSAVESISFTSDPQAQISSLNLNKVDKSINENYTILSASWSALASSSPFTYSATVTASHIIGNDTVCKLINDNAINFATYGFAIGTVNGQTLTIYSIGQPSASVTLEVDYYG